MDTETTTYPVESRFGQAVYLTVAIWTWWWYGKEWKYVSLTMRRDKP